MPPITKEFQQNKSRANDDGRIGDVERGPMVGLNVKIDEVGDAAFRQAIEDVAERSAQNHGHADLAHAAASTFGGKKPKQKNNHGNGERKEHEADRGRM